MQPHHPFVPDPLEDDSGTARTGARSSETDPWIPLRNGAVTERLVREAFEASPRVFVEVHEQDPDGDRSAAVRARQKAY